MSYVCPTGKALDSDTLKEGGFLQRNKTEKKPVILRLFLMLPSEPQQARTIQTVSCIMPKSGQVTLSCCHIIFYLNHKE